MTTLLKWSRNAATVMAGGGRSMKRLEEMSMLHGQTVSLEKSPDDFVLQEAKAIKNRLLRQTTCVSYR